MRLDARVQHSVEVSDYGNMAIQADESMKCSAVQLHAVAVAVEELGDHRNVRGCHVVAHKSAAAAAVVGDVVPTAAAVDGSKTVGAGVSQMVGPKV